MGEADFFEDILEEKIIFLGKDGDNIHDSLQRLTTVQIRGTQHDRNNTGDPAAITYRYDAEGRLTEKTCPGGIRTTWQYDGQDGLPVSLTHEDENGVLDRYTYAYDPFSNRTRMRDQQKGSATAYTYDAADRLTASEETTGEGLIRKTYEYDQRGNLTKELQEGIPSIPTPTTPWTDWRGHGATHREAPYRQEHPTTTTDSDSAPERLCTQK